MGTIGMLENLNLLTYVALGFVISYLTLEGGWHFTACRIQTSKNVSHLEQQKNLNKWS